MLSAIIRFSQHLGDPAAATTWLLNPADARLHWLTTTLKTAPDLLQQLDV